MKCNFTYEHYKNILKSVKSYKFITYDDFDSLNDGKKTILLRHDVDIDIFNALEFAKIEHRLGIKATYFIFLRSPFYNVFNPSVNKIIKEIIKLGHNIGLHFDNASYEGLTHESFENAIKKEADILKKEFDVDIKVISFHRPSELIKEHKVKLKGVKSTYDPIFFKDIKYTSDSDQFWKSGCPCQARYDKLQILTHPVWWGVEELDRDQRLNVFDKKLRNKLYSDLKDMLFFIRTEEDINKIKNSLK